jgi:hypothetical protein
MTIREALAMMKLYRACPDEAVRTRALELVPELAEFDDSAPVAVARWRLTATYSDGQFISDREVECSENALEAHSRDFVSGLPSDAIVSHELIA